MTATPLTIDTIAAVATPPGIGGVAIIRVSGPLALAIAERLCGQPLTPRYATYSPFLDTDGHVLDRGVALYFAAPHSFTGEEVVELQGHGGPVIVDLLLQTVLAYGARLARAGEFSERAFLNDKLDLVQAEAIADLISSQSVQAARAAVRSLEGDFSRKIHACVEAIIYTRMYVEAAIDFPEEEIDFLSDGKVLTLIENLLTRLAAISVSARQGTLLQEGLTLVIAGKPNAGKSSLLNALSGKDSAIVTAIAGTTRDILKESIQIDGLPLHLLDTAGLRDSTDPIEQEGIRRAKSAIAKADRLLLVIDASSATHASIKAEWQAAQVISTQPCTLILNKSDLMTEQSLADLMQALPDFTNTTVLSLSVLNQQGFAAFRQHLKASVAFDSQMEGSFSARRRHLDALKKAQQAIAHSREQLLVYQAGELVAEELAVAQRALNTITGEFSADDLLGEIFGSFCIGK